MGWFPLASSVRSAAAALATASSSSRPVTSTMRRSKSCACSQSARGMPCRVQPEVTCEVPTGFRFLPAMRSPHEPDRGVLSHLLASLVAFLDEHRYCGKLAGGAEFGGHVSRPEIHSRCPEVVLSGSNSLKYLVPPG